eukprot:156381-Rhodomonas_salina.1
MHFILQHHTVKAVWLVMDGKKQLHKAAVTRFAMQIYTFRSFVADKVHILACMHRFARWTAASRSLLLPSNQ